MAKGKKKKDEDEDIIAELDADLAHDLGDDVPAHDGETGEILDTKPLPDNKPAKADDGGVQQHVLKGKVIRKGKPEFEHHGDNNQKTVIEGQSEEEK